MNIKFPKNRINMRLTATCIACTLLLTACVTKGTNPVDPYESINRETHKFNMAFDATFLRPPAVLYKTIVPAQVRSGVNNFYNNINMLPTVANDLLQGEGHYAIKDSWRFLINSTLGIAGIFDVAAKFSLPPHSNDLGLTLAKWGDKKSPYIVIPFLGPSTIRDGMGMMFDYALFTPYPYIHNDKIIYSLLVLRYVDLRSQMLETDKFIAEAIDKYAFIRDAYLQHRTYLMTGEQPQDSTTSTMKNDDYVDDVGEVDDSKKILPEKPANGTPSRFPLTTASIDATHRTA